MKILSQTRIFAGTQYVYEHISDYTNCPMQFAIFVPDTVRDAGSAPALIYLSGLTCTWENVMAKAGAQKYAAEHNMVFIAPDTSPRGDDVADDEGYDLGQGAGFYVNATTLPWAEHYHMYDYIVKEMPAIIAEYFPFIDSDKLAITGHSMGGHGALVIGLRNPNIFKSISAFAPIVSPIHCPWGNKALATYLGDDRDAWQQYDACAIIKAGGALPPSLLVDVGLSDNFLDEELKPHLLEEACKDSPINLILNQHEGYDHSYYFIATFIETHIKFHSHQLSKG